MDLDKFLLDVTKSLSANTTIVEGIQRTLDTFQQRLYSLPTMQEFKDHNDDLITTCNDMDLVKTDVSEMKTKLGQIDTWQKVKLPFIVGMITLVIYAIGFFFMSWQIKQDVREMIKEKHPTEQTQPKKKAGS